MKQHITREQLSELTEERFIKFYKEIRPNTNKSIWWLQSVYKDICNDGPFGVNKLLSEINVGKMIELIQQNYELTIDEDSEKNKWVVVMYRKPVDSPAFDKHCYEDELADALWEAVKFIMEEEKC